jgi:hypothetical protein
MQHDRLTDRREVPGASMNIMHQPDRLAIFPAGDHLGVPKPTCFNLLLVDVVNHSLTGYSTQMLLHHNDAKRVLVTTAAKASQTK